MKIHLITGQAELCDEIVRRCTLIFADRPAGLAITTSPTLYDAYPVLRMEVPPNIILLDICTPVEALVTPSQRITYSGSSFLFLARNEKWPPVIAFGSIERFVKFTTATWMHPAHNAVHINSATSTDAIDDMLDLIDPTIQSWNAHKHPRH